MSGREGQCSQHSRTLTSTGCVDENEHAREGKGQSVRQEENQGLWYRKAKGRRGSVGVGRVKFTDGSCVDGMSGVELYCHGAKSKGHGDNSLSSNSLDSY